MNFMRKFRWLNRVYARMFGLFWLPCPICGRMFGGHECGGTLWGEFYVTGSASCWRCPGDRFVKG